jgi:hypothetical protein
MRTAIERRGGFPGRHAGRRGGYDLPAIGIDTHTVLHDRQNRPLAVLPEGDAIAEVLPA